MPKLDVDHSPTPSIVIKAASSKGDGKKVTTVIKGKDPGYGETCKFISEMALCITLEKDILQKCSGFLTPVECTGDLLVKRLRKAGISISYS